MLTIIFKLLTIFSPDTVRLADIVHKYAAQEIDEATAREHALAATIAATEDVPATLLLSMAYSESRYNPYAVSHVRDGRRQCGIFKAGKAPAGVSGPYFCGVTQVMAQGSWDRCVELRDIHLAYRTAVEELTRWVRVCRKADDVLRCALLGYGGGFPAIKAGTSTYPSRVLSRAKLFERRLASSGTI